MDFDLITYLVGMAAGQGGWIGYWLAGKWVARSRGK